MKRLLICTLCLLSFINSYSRIGDYDNLVDNFIKQACLKSASISLYAENITKGEVIINYNSNLSLVPASVAKIIPTSLSLDLLGANKRFRTDLAYSGSINNNGVLDGNIYIIAYGDPCLDSKFFTNHYNTDFSLFSTWLNKIKELGIKKINGDIICDVSYFGTIDIPGRWLWEDVANYYANQGSALCFRDNIYELHFKTSKLDNGKTEITKIVPDDLGFSFNNEVRSSANAWDEAFIYYTNQPKVFSVKGKLRWKKDNFIIKGSMPEPELYLVNSLIKEIKSSGILFSGASKLIVDEDSNVERKVFHSTMSPKLSDIVSIINMKSNNLFTEILSHHIKKYTGNFYADAVRDFFVSNNIDTNGLYVDDACGLSRLNAATSFQLVELLKYMKQKSKNSQVFVKSLPIAGKTGTLSSYCKATKAEGRVYAKSGSMARVRAHAGYINDLNNNDIAFCFIVNNYDCKNNQIKKMFETLFVEIVTK